MESGHSLIGLLSSMFVKYLNTKADAFRKRVVTCLSEGAAMVLVLFVMLMVLMIAMFIFSFGFILMIAEMLGNWCAAAFIVGAILLAVVIILFLLCRRLFSHMFQNKY